MQITDHMFPLLRVDAWDRVLHHGVDSPLDETTNCKYCDKCMNVTNSIHTTHNVKLAINRLVPGSPPMTPGAGWLVVVVVLLWLPRYALLSNYNEFPAM